MAKRVIDDATLTAIADAIRDNSGDFLDDAAKFLPSEMPDRISEVVSQAFTTGEEQGWENGHTEGYNNGYTEGYDEGWQDGYTDGNEDGYIIGYDNGHSGGYDIGFYEGKDEGKDEGLEAGAKAERDRFWDAIQHEYGSRVSYGNAFANWKIDSSTFKPKYTIAPTNAATMFMGARLPNSNAEPIDVIQMEATGEQIFDFSNCANLGGAFRTDAFKTLGTIDLSAIKTSASMDYCFYLADGNYVKGAQLTHINRLISTENVTWSNGVFGYQTKLEYIGFEGVIAKGGLNLQWSTMLNKSSIEKLVGILSTTTSGLSITLSQIAVDVAFETDEAMEDGSYSAEWRALANTRSNWTINLV